MSIPRARETDERKKQTQKDRQQNGDDGASQYCAIDNIFRGKEEDNCTEHKNAISA